MTSLSFFTAKITRILAASLFWLVSGPADALRLEPEASQVVLDEEVIVRIQQARITANAVWRNSGQLKLVAQIPGAARFLAMEEGRALVTVTVDGELASTYVQVNTLAGKDSEAESTSKPPEQAIFEGEIGERWEPVSVAGGNFKRFAQPQQGVLLVDVPADNSWGKTGIKSREQLLTMDNRFALRPFEVNIRFDPKLTDGYRAVFTPHPVADVYGKNNAWFSWVFNPKTNSAMIAMSNTQSELDPGTRIQVSTTPPEEVTFRLSPGRIESETSDGQQLSNRFAWLKHGTPVYLHLFSHPHKEQASARMAVCRISLRDPSGEIERTEKLRSTQAIKQVEALENQGWKVIFSGAAQELPGSWRPLASAGGNFQAHARLSGGRLRIEAPHRSYWAKTGIASSESRIEITSLNDIHPHLLRLDFDADQTRYLVFAIHNSSVQDLWRHSSVYLTYSLDPQGAGYSLGLIDSGDHEKTPQHLAAKGAPPEWVELRLYPGRAEAVTSNGLQLRRDYSWLRPGQKYYVYLFSNAPAEHESTRASISSISLKDGNALGRAAIQKELDETKQLLERALQQDFERLRLSPETILPFLSVPGTAPPIAPPEPQACHPEPNLFSSLLDLLIPAAHAAGDCDQALDDYIALQRRVAVTFGKNSDLQGAAINLATTMIGKTSFSPGYLETVRGKLDQAITVYQGGNTSLEAYEKGDFGEAGIAFTRTVMKVMMDSVQNETDLKAMNGVTRDLLNRSLQRMPPEQRQKVLAQLSHALKNQDIMKDVLAKGDNLDAGAVIGQAVGGDYLFLWTLFRNTVIANHPVLAKTQAALKFAYEGAKAVEDWLADDKLSTHYKVYKETLGEGGAGAKTLWDGRTLHEGLNRTGIKKVMRKLGKGPVSPDGKPLPISDLAAEQFLKEQFAAWHAEEKLRGALADALAINKKGFEKINALCRSGIKKRLPPKGLPDRLLKPLGIGDTCREHVALFREYAELRNQVRRELAIWQQPGNTCGDASMEDAAEHLVCDLASYGSESYRLSLARKLEACGLLPEPLVAIRERHLARIEQQLPKLSEHGLSALLRKEMPTKVLNCLCPGGFHYHPKDCGKPSHSGPCRYMGPLGGITCAGLETTPERLKACGATKALADDMTDRYVRRLTRDKVEDTSRQLTPSG